MDITINNITYQFNNELGELPIGTYLQFQKILGRRELIKQTLVNENTVDITDEGIYEQVEVGKESEEFIRTKYEDVVILLSNIPEMYVRDYPNLIEELLPLIKDFEDDNTLFESVMVENDEGVLKKGYVFEYDDDWYFLPFVDMFTFQEWSNIETFTRFNEDILYTLVTLLRRFKDTPNIEERGSKLRKYRVCLNAPKFNYNDTSFRMEDKYAVISSIQTKYVYLTFKLYLEHIDDVKTQYRYIYGQHNIKSRPSPNYNEFSRLVGWEDTIGKIAETTAFNSNKGALYAVRYAYFIDVLEYLNVKRGRDIAESMDYDYRENNRKMSGN